MQEMLDSAKRIVLEVNPTMPFVFGTEGDHINIADVDCVVENSEPISTVQSPAANDIDRQIAQNIFPYLRDGITLQLGIGGMPNSLGTLIADSDLKDLGMNFFVRRRPVVQPPGALRPGGRVAHGSSSCANTKTPTRIFSACARPCWRGA